MSVREAGRERTDKVQIMQAFAVALRDSDFIPQGNYIKEQNDKTVTWALGTESSRL